MKRKISLAFAIVLLIAPLCHCQQSAAPGETNPIPKEALAAASRALKLFPAMVNRKNFKAMGFKSPTEVSQATLGQPMKVFQVRLDRLKKYEPNMPPDSLLETANNQIVFPLNVNRQARCSITVCTRKKRWVASRFGSSNLTKLLSAARQASMKITRLPLSAYTIVRIPALNMVFIAHRDKETKGLMLTPILSDPKLKMKAGSSMPATEVFNKLVPLARSHNGLPT